LEISVKKAARMPEVHSILIRKLKEHSRLAREDLAAINALRHKLRDLAAHEDLIRQGDDPDVSAVVVSGILARYHLLPNGRRQYLSFHLSGDMPDSQALFVEKMDHAVCAMGPAVVALIPHKDLLSTFERRPSVGFAIWRETLIDAAIFREAITNNSARTTMARLAHLFCELFYRARASGLTQGPVLGVAISLVQLAETLAMSIATVNRTLLELRQSRTAQFQRGRLEIKDWDALVEIGQFNPSYLHQKRPPV
jgi:CRP-like cAMP-binding protein